MLTQCQGFFSHHVADLVGLGVGPLGPCRAGLHPRKGKSPSHGMNGPGFTREETEQTRLVASSTSLGASESHLGEDYLFCWGCEMSELMDERQKMQSAVLEFLMPNI